LGANQTTDAKSTDADSPALELRGVSKSFGSRKVLDDIDVAVLRGEILAIVGPSGCGKTTLLKIISGIETVDRGQVLLCGRDCTSLPAYRRPVHTVFQNYALFPHLDVASNVAFPLEAARMPRQQREKLVGQALGWVQLQSHARRNVNSLSGGERQRVALARALVDSPQCVLLDEPLSALDPHLRVQTLRLLKDIQQRLGTTFVFITHDREEALRLGHRVGVLNGGRLEQIGTPEEMYRRPRTAFVASFVGKINWIPARLVDASGQRALIVGDAKLPCDNGIGVAAGAVRLGIRPEDIEIGHDGWLAAHVTGRQFVGGMTVVELRLASGTELVIHRREVNGELSIGQQVRLGWPPDAAHLFPADGEGPA
jgi:ABC-type Fe3+/spermidine/putrescine transport system ATPase subunit